MCPEKGQGEVGPFRKGTALAKAGGEEGRQPVLSVCDPVGLTLTKGHTGDSERDGWGLDLEALSVFGLVVRSLL